MVLYICNYRSRECFFNFFYLENYVVIYFKFLDLFIIRIYIVVLIRIIIKSFFVISKLVVNVKVIVNSGGGDNGVKIVELT